MINTLTESNTGTESKGKAMATNILLVNQKGGVGKTTFAHEIAWGLKRRGVEVGFTDLDPQGGAAIEENLLDGEDAVNVIDTPGSISERTAEWAKHADVAIIPVTPGTLGVKPMKRTLRVITSANPELAVGIVVNNFSARRVMDRQSLEFLEADELPVLGTVPTAVAFQEGMALGRSVVEMNPKSKAALAVEEIVEQVMEVIGRGE